MSKYECGHEFLVSVGSGTITDITKYVSHKLGKPHVVCATAPSMDGYTSTAAPLISEGFKQTFYVGTPAAVFADLDVLTKAPKELIMSGFGDIMGKVTAGIDWAVSRIVTGEYYCPVADGMMMRAVNRCLDNRDAIVQRRSEGIAVLTDALILSGVAMVMAKTSRPASGAEHLLSHFWEMKHWARFEKWDLHGVRVGIGTLLVVKFYERVLRVDPEALDRSKLRSSFWDAERRSNLVRRAYGTMAEQAMIEAEDKYVTWEQREQRLEHLVMVWGDVRKEIAERLGVSSDLRTSLEKLGAPLKAGDLGITKDELMESILASKEMRGRYTAFDLGEELGVLNEWASELVGI